MPRPSPRLLGTATFRLQLELALSALNQSIDVVSAFASISGIEWLVANVPRALSKRRILVRWRADDLVTGIGKLEIFPLLAEHGWELSMNPSLHAKVLLLDRKRLFLGSANLTSRGLATGADEPNIEMGTEVEATKRDVAVIEGLFVEAVPITPELVSELRDWLALQTPAKSAAIEYPPPLAAMLQADTKRLWVAEMPWATPAEALAAPQSEECRHDMTLLDGPEGESRATRLRRLRCHRWLVSQVRQAPNRQLYFGELTARLHEALLDDPLPYRSTVKRLLANLLSWVEVDSSGQLTIDTPSHSQRVTLRA